MLYGHGDDMHIVKGELKANFSSNVLPVSMSKDLVAHLSTHIRLMENYPEPQAYSLAVSIAKKQKLAIENILPTNGATEAFYLIAELFARTNTTILVPSFAEYEDACCKYQHNIDFLSNVESLENIDFNMDTFWVCNPNNPDGKLYDTQQLLSVAKQNPSVCFVVDEAYIEFSRSVVSLLEQAVLLPNLVVVRSLTKKYVIPGLRLGYIVAHSTLVERLKQLIMPWRIGSLSIAGGVFLMGDRQSEIEGLHEFLLNEAEKLQLMIDELPGFSVIPSKTHYFLVKCPCSASQIKEYLLKEHQILVRDASNFRGLSKDYIRVSTQQSEQNNLLLKALQTWLTTSQL